MKFRQSEYQSFKRIIESCPISYEEFFFVKKRGRLNVKYKDHVFAFHRRTSVDIVDGNFKETEYYDTWLEKDEKRLNNWEEVEARFFGWIKSLT